MNQSTDIYTYENLYRYCLQDVVSEVEVYDRLPKLSPLEKDVHDLNVTINERGIPVDVVAINQAINTYETHARQLNARLKQITRLPNPNSNPQFKDWLLACGVDVPDVQRQTLEQLDKTGMDERVKTAIHIKLLLAKTPIRKYHKMLQAEVNGRIYNCFIYHGASTGRFSSHIINMQNAPRPVEAMEGLESEAISYLKYEDPDVLMTLYDEPVHVLSSIIRGMIKAPDGKRLMVADYAAIEARVLAWIAEEKEVLHVFRTHGKLYEHTAAGIYGKKIEDITKGSQERFIGKVAALALGYQGGVKAFQGMAKQYGVDIEEKQAQSIRDGYRSSNRAIVDFWSRCNAAALAALKCPIQVGKESKHFTVGRVEFFRRGSFLYIKLPSERLLAYYQPRIIDGPYGHVVSYMGVNSVTRKWERTTTYGGKLTENIVQAIARDLLVYAMLNLERHGYEIIMTVHDEIVAEVPEDHGSLKEFEEIMCWLPAWAQDLPIAAEGYEAERYRK